MRRVAASCLIWIAGCSSSGGAAEAPDGGLSETATTDTSAEAPADDGDSPEVAGDTPPLAKCGFVSQNPTCQACLEANCCAAGRACAASDACTKELRRRHACIDCNDLPASDVVAFDQCLDKSCHVACGDVSHDEGIFHGYKGVGDPCLEPDSCITGRCSLAHACIRRCTTDLDCAGYPDLEGSSVVHVCVDNKKGEKLCLPRCDVQADCNARFVKVPTGAVARSEPLRCADVGASHKACVIQRDPGPVPACYPNDSSLGGTPCDDDTDCLCDTNCQTKGGTLGSCIYTCTTTDSCLASSDGLLATCFKGGGDTFCAP